MKKYILALILGCGIILQGQSVCAQVEDADSENTPTIQTVDKNILADEELMKTITPKQLEEYIAQGADVNIKFTRKIKGSKTINVSPLMSAVFGVSHIKVKATDSCTPLMFAANGNQNPEVVETLIKHGADVNAQNSRGETALMFAAEYNKNPEVIETLIRHGADVNAKDEDSAAALKYAAEYNENSEVVETLIKHGADVNAKDESGAAALMYAAQYNKNPEVVETLIKHGADVNAKDESGWTPLMFAAEYNKNPEVIETLIRHGADVNAQNSRGKTALIEAVRDEKTEVIETLLKHGADVNAKTSDGWTALRYANLHNENSQIVKLLQKYIVEIIKVYDCPSGNYHKLCGIFENKTSSKQSASVRIYYYDEDDIKIGEGVSTSVEIDPYGKARFDTRIFNEPFDHYKTELIIN